MKKAVLEIVHFRLILTCICLTFSFSSCTAKCPQRDAGDDDTYLSLTKQRNAMPPKLVLKSILKSENVTAFAIDALSEDSVAEKVYGFCTTGKSKELTSSQMNLIKSVIIDESSYYKEDDIVKYSTFIPDYAFKFMNGKDSVVVFMDFHSDKWSFRYKKKDYTFDNERISPRLKALVRRVFNIKLEDKKEDFTVQNSMKINGLQKTEVEVNDLQSQNDNPKYKKLSSKLQDILTSADSILCYILDPMSEDKDEKRLGKYVILQERQLDTKTAAQVTSKLLDKESFQDLPYVQNCTFLPDIAFVYVTKNDRVNVMFSFYCNECRILLNDEFEFQNECINIRTDIIELAKRVFPKDKYLRNLSKK